MSKKLRNRNNVVIIDVKHRMGDSVSRNNTVNDLLWYDVKKKKMLKFRGGKLVMKHKFDPEFQEYRWLPEAENELTSVKTKKTDKNLLVKFYKDYLNYNDSNITIEDENSNGITFSVPEDELDDFSYNLERSGFNYDER